MNGTVKLVAPLVAVLAVAACNGGSSSIPGATGSAPVGQAISMRHIPDWLAKHQARPVCPMVIAQPTCLALDVYGVNNSSPSGWTPTDLQAVYRTPSTQGSGQIVAIVDAYDNPNVASDLATYRKQFNLGAANFTKYNQNGQTSGFPSGSPGWGVEIDLDVDMVSAICPKCTIYLIEANSSSSADLDTAENTAVKKLGAHIVSNSWICYGSNSCVDVNSFNKSGVVYLAGSGDGGYDQNGNPESLATVVSVGGTQLPKSGSTYSETVWSGSGGGCSSNGGSMGVTKPPWQHDPSCTWRTDSDVAAEAGCAPGVAEYDTYGSSGWIQECGTSAATPMNAAIFALAGNASKQIAASAFWKATQRHRRRTLHAITVGNDGSCGGSYLCTAGTHQFKSYSGPTGWGTPKGVGLY